MIMALHAIFLRGKYYIGGFVKVLAPMSVEQYEAIVKLVDAGVRSAGFQACTEISLAGKALLAVQDVDNPDEEIKTD